MHRAGCEEVNYNPACKPGREGGGRAPLAQGRAHPVRSRVSPPVPPAVGIRGAVAALRDGLLLRHGVPPPPPRPSRWLLGPRSAALSRDMRSK